MLHRCCIDKTVGIYVSVVLQFSNEHLSLTFNLAVLVYWLDKSHAQRREKLSILKRIRQRDREDENLAL